jgi:predicted TIM-barrel fold metal-dependent hydrolase
MPTSTYYDLKLLSENSELVPSGQQDFPYQKENEFLLYECELFGEGHTLPFLAINPREKVREQLLQIKKWMKRYKIYGLKFHTLATHSKATALRRTGFIELAKSHNLPIMIHAGFSGSARPKYIFEIAKENPEVRFCVAHLADFSQELFNLLDIDFLPNLFIDPSPFMALCVAAAYEKNTERKEFDFRRPDIVLRQLAERYSENLIWGTDEPWTTPVDKFGNIIERVDYEDEVILLNSLPKYLKQKIAYENSIRFLGKIPGLS